MYALDLSLKHEWYNMIEQGEKREEYRDFLPYYANRLYYAAESGWMLIRGKCGIPYVFYGVRRYDAVRFHKGQGGKQTMLFEFAGLEIGKGRPEWGAPDEVVFIIKLGRRIG